MLVVVNEKSKFLHLELSGYRKLLINERSRHEHAHANSLESGYNAGQRAAAENALMKQNML